MPNLTLSINAKIQREMKAFPEINWSQVARSAIERKLAEMKFLAEFTKESEITLEDAQELGKKVGKAIAAQYKMNVEMQSDENKKNIITKKIHPLEIGDDLFEGVDPFTLL
ncbi:MAG: hypothetical protein ACTSXK_07845 [Promethearchaeota archaeon]